MEHYVFIQVCNKLQDNNINKQNECEWALNKKKNNND